MPSVCSQFGVVDCTTVKSKNIINDCFIIGTIVSPLYSFVFYTLYTGRLQRLLKNIIHVPLSRMGKGRCPEWEKVVVERHPKG